MLGWHGTLCMMSSTHTTVREKHRSRLYSHCQAGRQVSDESRGPLRALGSHIGSGPVTQTLRTRRALPTDSCVRARTQHARAPAALALVQKGDGRPTKAGAVGGRGTCAQRQNAHHVLPHVRPILAATCNNYARRRQNGATMRECGDLARQSPASRHGIVTWRPMASVRPSALALLPERHRVTVTLTVSDDTHDTCSPLGEDGCHE